MSRLQKAIESLKSCNGTFPYRDLVSLLAMLGYLETKTGGGSRRRFVHPELKDVIRLHEPHPETHVKGYAVREIREHLLEKGLI